VSRSKGEVAQIQRLRKGADEPLPVRPRTIGRHIGNLGQRSLDLTGFVRDEDARMADGVEPVLLRTRSGVRELRVAPAQKEDRIRRECLRRAVDLCDVADPDCVADFRGTGPGVRSPR